MNLIVLAQNLQAKIDSFVNDSSLSEAEIFRLREEIRAEAKGIAYAVDSPEQALKAISRGYTTSTALKICSDLELAQHLPVTESRSLEDLAVATGCNSRVLRPVLRLLSQNGIFRQSDDGRWRHTEMSTVMTEPSFRAWMTSILEEKYRSVAYLPRALKGTGYCLPSPGEAAFNAVYATSFDFYTYSNELDHEAASNFAVSMEELARGQLPFFENSYRLDKLDPHSHFVDVAGGLGNLSIFLAEKLPHATFVVQDHPFIVEQGRQTCPLALRDRISFEAHDMMTPQLDVSDANKGKLVFLLKIILHDHGDTRCQVLLRNLLSVMNRGDRILIIDTVIPKVGGSLSSSMSDMIILSMFGCGHRTLEEFYALINDCGQNLTIENFTGGREEFDGMMVIEIRKNSS